MRRILHIILTVTVAFTVNIPLMGKPQRSTPPQAEVEAYLTTTDYYLYAIFDAMAKDNHAQAYFLLEFCYHLDPTNPTVCAIYGSYTEQLFGAEEALPLYRTAYEGSPQDYWYRYAVTAYTLGHKRETEKVLARIEKTGTDNEEEVLELREQIYRNEHKYKKALAMRDRLDRLTGEPTAYSVITRYEILSEMGETKKAIKVLQDYLSANPNDGRMKAMLGDIYLRQARQRNDTTAGRQLLNEALHSDDVSLSTKRKLIQRNKDWLNIVDTQQGLLLDDLLSQYPFEEEAHLEKLQFLIEQQSWQEAREAAQPMLLMFPTNEQLRNMVLNILQQDDEVSIEDFYAFAEESFAVLPDNPLWIRLKCRTLLVRGESDSALNILEERLARIDFEPSDKVQLLYMESSLLMRKQRYADLFNCFEQILQIIPDDAETLNNYAYILAINGGDLKKAERMSQRAVQKDGNNASYLDTYAWILHLQGQDNLALFYIRKALECNTDTDDHTIQEHYEAIKSDR